MDLAPHGGALGVLRAAQDARHGQAAKPHQDTQDDDDHQELDEREARLAPRVKTLQHDFASFSPALPALRVGDARVAVRLILRPAPDGRVRAHGAAADLAGQLDHAVLVVIQHELVEVVGHRVAGHPLAEALEADGVEEAVAQLGLAVAVAFEAAGGVVAVRRIDIHHVEGAGLAEDGAHIRIHLLRAGALHGVGPEADVVVVGRPGRGELGADIRRVLLAGLLHEVPVGAEPSADQDAEDHDDHQHLDERETLLERAHGEPPGNPQSSSPSAATPALVMSSPVPNFPSGPAETISPTPP